MSLQIPNLATVSHGVKTENRQESKLMISHLFKTISKVYAKVILRILVLDQYYVPIFTNTVP